MLEPKTKGRKFAEKGFLRKLFLKINVGLESKTERKNSAKHKTYILSPSHNLCHTSEL